MSKRGESQTISLFDPILEETGTVNIDSMVIHSQITEAGRLGGSVG